MAAVRVDAGNKNAASAYVMGAGGLAVDAMSIGCLGVARGAQWETIFRTDSEPRRMFGKNSNSHEIVRKESISRVPCRHLAVSDDPS